MLLCYYCYIIGILCFNRVTAIGQLLGNLPAAAYFTRIAATSSLDPIRIQPREVP
jgi:hypothetical protein